jgi:hypothetical protein
MEPALDRPGVMVRIVVAEAVGGSSKR